jgi:ABC-2 type transport system permease protein
MHPSLQILLQLGWLLLIDFLLLAVLALCLVPLAIYKKAAFAVLKRNFVGYFGNPTGYLFLCAFVLVTTLVAFVPPDFFASNLANLDQLNKWLPLIMLFYVPTITMSIWSEERRQGTDELLLTLPADDFDIVVGKYLAAAAVFTAALVFSQLSNLSVLVSLTLGELDIGLLFTTYLGYWLMGMAMLSIGMVASFLTRNLTVGFMLGVLFNGPLVGLGYVQSVVASDVWAQRLRQWSLSAGLEEFGRGVVSVSALVYFALIIVVGIYLSMVLIGRRHWLGGRDGHSMLAIVIVAISMNAVSLASNFGRIDSTENNVNSLSPETKKLIREISSEQPVKVEAYISASVPETYVKARRDLITMLRAMKSIGGSKLSVTIHDNIDAFDETAQRANERYGIRPQAVPVDSRGSIREEKIILAAAFTRGLEKVVVPFFDIGVPTEYELARSIATVAQSDRLTIGVAHTDAQMFGGFSGGMMMMQPRSIPKRAVITELEQQYNVEEVQLTGPIEADKYDALLVVQPSSLTPQQMTYLIDAINTGLPTAIFEDPRSLAMGVPDTGAPKQAPGGMFGGGGPPPEKADIRQLWEAIGIQSPGDVESSMRSMGPPLFAPEIVWQNFNPYPQLSGIVPEFVFISENTRPGFSQTDPITSGLQEVLFPFAGSIKRITGTPFEFEKLAETDGEISGSIPYSKAQMFDPATTQHGEVTGSKTIAARIRGKQKSKSSADSDKAKADAENKKEEDKKADADKNDDEKKADSGKKRKSNRAKDAPLHVVYVADSDLMHDQFLTMRNRPDERLQLRLDNLTFVLNIVDSLAGDDRFIEIRKRKLRYSTLKLVESVTSQIKNEEVAKLDEAKKEMERAIKEYTDDVNKSYKALEDKVKELQDKQQRGESISLSEMIQMQQDLETQKQVAQERIKTKTTQLNARYESDQEKLHRDYEQELQQIRNSYKAWAVLLPPLPPLLVGLVVFARRRLREREGIARSRLK